MSFNPVDYQRIRAQTEERLKPLIRLQRLRNWLFLEIGLFFAAVILVFSGSHPDFYITYQQSGTDMSGNIFTYTVSEFSRFYNTLVAIAVAGLVLLIVQVIILWMSFQHERFMQREMNKDMELERLHLMAHQADQSAAEQPEAYEKPKHSVRLSDDGELISEDASQEPLMQRVNRRAR